MGILFQTFGQFGLVFFFFNNRVRIVSSGLRVDPPDTIVIGLTRLYKTQTLFSHVVFMSGSRIVSKIANPSRDDQCTKYATLTTGVAKLRKHGKGVCAPIISHLNE